MRKTLGALALVSLALLGAGCKKGSPLVGKWTAQEAGNTVDWEFTADGNATMTAKNGPIQVIATETYKLEGDKLTMTAKNVDIKGGQPGQAEIIKKFAQSQIGKEQNDTLKFDGDDKATITDPKGRTLALTRSK